MAVYTHKIKKLKPLHDYVLVKDMNFYDRFTSGGILIPSDDTKNSGIRPRWAQVFAIGPDQHDVSVGQWVCVAHGRWTRGVAIENDDGKHVLRRVDNNDILLVTDTEPMDDTFSDKAI